MDESDDVRGDQKPDERLQESAVDVATFIAAGTGIASIGLAGVQAHYARASFTLQRQEAEERAAERAEYLAFQQELYDLRRRQAFEHGGLAGLDEFDEWHYDGPFGGFEID